MNDDFEHVTAVIAFPDDQERRRALLRRLAGTEHEVVALPDYPRYVVRPCAVCKVALRVGPRSAEWMSKHPEIEVWCPDCTSLKVGSRT